ncbi:MAG TPA: family 78 glycoside hydrolase catalytic domain [Egibacteraceae bacterium]|nr:family 78 glycoside hydrolase catalytic domain [Egibacteraceae bacterium]
MRPRRLRCEHLHDPLGIDRSRPWLSWAIDGDTTPAQVRVRVASDASVIPAADLWDSGPLPGTLAGVTYGGAPLQSRQQVWWTVTATDDRGVDQCSQPARFEMGLLDDTDWTAEWIGLPWTGSERPAPQLRTTVAVDAPVIRARLYASALGVYRLWLAGAEVTPDRLAPGWRDYRRRVPYRTYDVTALLSEGAHVLAAQLGEGWWSGAAGLRAIRNRYGERPHLRLQLEIDHADGRRVTHVTDGRWRGAFGAVRQADLLLGESQDLRRHPAGWTDAAVSDGDWRAVTVDRPPVGRMAAAARPPVRVTGQRPAVTVTRRQGRHVVDFGQNAAGWVRLALRGPAGATVTVRHGEWLEPDGRVHTANQRQAANTDRYVLAGGRAVVEPAFTTHGFRYAEITADDGAVLDEAVAPVVHTDVEATGSFDCSDPLLNQIVDAIAWTQRSNAVELPTDCPQRDERLGWLGDAYVFGPTAVFGFDLAAWLSDWYGDILDARRADGSFPDVAPLIDAPDLALAEGAPGWGDAGVTLPWLLYTWYGDPAIVRRAYPAAVAWLQLICRHNPDGVWRHRRGNDYGDWLGYEVTSKELLATAILARTADTVAAMARVVDDAAGAERHARVAAHVRNAFATAFIAPDGRIAGDTQTGYALPLRFGVVPPPLRAATQRHLVAAVERWPHPATGYLGVAHLLPALTDAGRVDLAYALVQSRELPSWGYQLAAGATTFWERWDGWSDDRGLHDPVLNSLNHNTLGSVGEWLRSTVAGLDPLPGGPGFATAVVAPRPGGGLTHASATLTSVRGDIAVDWSRDGDHLDITLTIPATVQARLRVPAAAGARIATAAGAVTAERPAPSIVLGPGRHRVVVDGALA